MERLVWKGVKHETVPENFVLPPEARAELHMKACKQVPVIRFSGENQREISKQILDAGKEFGFFQVVDHGISEQVISDMMQVSQEFFDMPVEDRSAYYSDDPTKIPRLFTSIDSRVQGKRFWRDCLRLARYGKGDEFRHLYPEKPSRLRDVVVMFEEEVAELGTRILNLISQGLGLGEDYFSVNFKGQETFNINYYPPCPDPSLTLGLPKHCDPNLITLLLQGEVSGLQVLHDGQWLQVDPIPNAFVVNFGHMLEIITNGLLKSAEHRAVTNKNVARTTIATFFMPPKDCFIAPARQLLLEYQNPPFYKSFSFVEFVRVFQANQAAREKILDAFMIQN